MKIRKLKECVVTNKNVLLRGDLNVPIRDGKVTDDTRLKALVPTIKYLIENNAKVVLCSHLGDPKGEVKPELSLRIVLPELQKLLPNVKIHFADDCTGDIARKAVENAHYGEIVLLENLRYHKGEKKNEEAFARELASLANLYVNDAFSVSHRAHASMVGVPAILKGCAGFLLEKEVESLVRLVSNPDKPVMVMVGGSKVSTKLSLLNALISKADYVLVGGGMANTFLYAMGYNIGKSLHEPELKEEALEVIRKAEENDCKLILPKDVKVCKELKDGCESQTIALDKIAEDDIIADLGNATVLDAIQDMRNCKTIIWNGPVGVYEIYPFNDGTKDLAVGVEELTKSGKLMSVGGGGDLLSALNKAGLGKGFTYLSTAGGAFLAWLEGEELPGVKAVIE